MNDQRPQTPALTVHGAWHGEVGDPRRLFKGQVTQSSVGGVQVGDSVTVSYDAPAQRTPDLGSQGSYTLHLKPLHPGTQGDRKVPLMSFTNLTQRTGGKQDTEAEYWQATPIPQ